MPASGGSNMTEPYRLTVNEIKGEIYRFQREHDPDIPFSIRLYESNGEEYVEHTGDLKFFAENGRFGLCIYKEPRPVGDCWNCHLAQCKQGVWTSALATLSRSSRMRDPNRAAEDILQKVQDATNHGYYTHPGEPDACVICRGLRYDHEPWCIVGRLEEVAMEHMNGRSTDAW